MMTPESKVKSKVKAILNEYKIPFFMPMGTLASINGVSDFVCTVPPGFALYIETKSTGDKMPTALQAAFLKKHAEAGAFCWIIDADNIELFARCLCRQQFADDSMLRWRDVNVVSVATKKSSRTKGT